MKGKKTVSKKKVANKKVIVKKSKVVKKAVAKKAAPKKVVRKAKPIKKVVKKPAPRKVAKKIKKVPGEYSNKNLVKALKLLNIKAAEMARRLNVSSAYLSNWLNDIKLVPLQHALDIEVMTEGKVKAKSLNPEAYAQYAKELRKQAKMIAMQQAFYVMGAEEALDELANDGIAKGQEVEKVFKQKEQMMNEVNDVEVNEDANPVAVEAEAVSPEVAASEDLDNADHEIQEAEVVND